MAELKILLTCTGLSLVFTNCSIQSQSSRSPPPKIVTEVAAYRIKATKNKDFSLLLTNFCKQVAQFDCYNHYLILQDLQYPNIYQSER